MAMRRIGIFSGTYDPVHRGHVQFALEAAATANLDKVVLLPEANPWREKKPTADINQRRLMVELATRQYPNLELGEVGNERFKVEKTLPLLVKRYGNDIIFLFGSDAFLRMSSESWPSLALLLPYPFVIGLRDEDTTERVAEHAKIIGAKVTVVETNHRDHASTHVRRNAHEHSFIDPRVARYIVSNKLYGLGL